MHTPEEMYKLVNEVETLPGIPALVPQQPGA